MSQLNNCPECGAPIGLDAPQGLCPACLIRIGADGLLPTAASHGEASVGGTAVAATAASAMAFPALFGGYELLGEIGRGGMGVVYQARQVALNRPVALKLLLHGRFSDAAFLDRFHLEAEAAAHLDHPHIVPIYEVGVQEGQPYYSMRLIEGRSLGQLIAECRGPNAEHGRKTAECGTRNGEWVRRSAELVATIARAVQHAHQHGVLHRDIKPHNILLDAEGQPYLTDFGLAKLLNEDSGLTVSVAVIGSPGFMAPEQAAGKSREITTAADIYGLGAVLYAMLTGKAVFQADTPLETVRLVIEQEPVRPRTLNPAVDRNLETVCLKCLQKEPAQRYASALALAEDLESWLRAEPIQARRVSEVERLWLWCRRRPVRAGLTGALLLVFALGLAGVLWQWRQAKASELFARRTAYAFAMNLAQRALVNNEVGQAINLLDKCRPAGKADPSSVAAQRRVENRKQKAEIDLRGWEWRYLWQLCQGAELSILHRYSSGISSVAVSKDGKLLAVGNGSGVSLWDLATKRPIADLPESASKLAFSPTDSLLAVASSNEGSQPVVKLWNVNSHKLAATFTSEAPVVALDFSPDGKLLAMLDSQGSFSVTESPSNHLLLRRKVSPVIRRGGAGVVAFSRDGKRLVIGSDMGVLLLLDWQSGEPVSLQTGTADGVTALAISPRGDLAAAGFGFTDGRIGLWELSTGKVQSWLTNHTAWVKALAFTPDGQWLVSGGSDRTIRVWNTADHSELRSFRARQEVEALAVLPDGKTLVTGESDGALRLWDCSAPVRSGGPARLSISYGLQSQGGEPAERIGPGPPDPKVVRRLGVAFTPDSRSFITSDPAGALAVYDALSMQIIEPLPDLGSNNWGVAFPPDGRWLAAANASGKIEIWDWKTRRAVASLKLPFEWIGRIRFSRSGRFLLASATANDRAHQLMIWETRRWTEIPAGRVRHSSFLQFDLSPDDRLLVLAYSDGTVQLREFPSGRQVTSFKKPGSYLAARFSPDGRLLALGRREGSVMLWDVVNRREFAPALLGHALGTWQVVFSPDGRRLLTGGWNPKEAAKLWDIATASELLVLPAEGQIFYDACFSPDGGTLVASSFSGVAHFWRAPSWAEIEAAEKRDGRQP